MVTLQDIIDIPEGRFIVLRIYTSCCKGYMSFKELPNGDFFDMQKLEVCDRGWNDLIRQKLKLYHEDQRFKT